MQFNFDDRSIDIDETGVKLIENAKKVIETAKTSSNGSILIDKVMNELYEHFSKYSEERLNNFNLQFELFKVENLLDDVYLPLNTVPIYDENSHIIPKNITEILDYLVHCTRKKLASKNDLKKDALSKKCLDTSDYLEKICSELGIETIHIGVDQGLNNGMFHHFTIVRIRQDDSTYRDFLVDCTYRQFFTKKDSNPRRIGVMRGPVSGCSIGSYMMMTEDRKKMAETILTKGYIELNAETLKTYLDAIIYSGRSKDYYQKNNLDYMNPNDVSPEFSIDDYLQMLLFNRVIDGKAFWHLSNEIMDTSLEKSHSI